MTRVHAAKKLLEHGPLMFEEFRSITGWPSLVCQDTLGHLKQRGIIRHNGQHNSRTLWELTRKGRAQ
jgi:DNA-binding HxlR family transcriptional regulator